MENASVMKFCPSPPANKKVWVWKVELIWCTWIYFSKNVLPQLTRGWETVTEASVESKFYSLCFIGKRDTLTQFFSRHQAGLSPCVESRICTVANQENYAQSISYIQSKMTIIVSSIPKLLSLKIFQHSQTVIFQK